MRESGTHARQEVPASERIVVLARLHLIAQAVGAALQSRGFAVDDAPLLPGSAAQLADLGHGDVVVVLEDLEPGGDLEHFTGSLTFGAAPLVVLTPRRPGLAWRTLQRLGAAVVLSADASLDEVGRAITDLRGRAV